MLTASAGMGLLSVTLHVALSMLTLHCLQQIRFSSKMLSFDPVPVTQAVLTAILHN